MNERPEQNLSPQTKGFLILIGNIKLSLRLLTENLSRAVPITFLKPKEFEINQSGPSVGGRFDGVKKINGSRYR